jgi:CRISPR-associated protein Cas5d
MSRHVQLARRKGQCFHQPCLGTREFPARFRLIEPDEPTPQAISETRGLGIMLYDIDHAGDRGSIFFRARLDRGVLQVPPPGSADTQSRPQSLTGNTRD